MHHIIAVFVNRTTIEYPGAFEVFGINATVNYNCSWYWLVYSSADSGAILKDLAKTDDSHEVNGNCTSVLKEVNVTNDTSSITEQLV